MLHSLACTIFVAHALEVERLHELILEGGGACEEYFLAQAQRRLALASERLVKETLTLPLRKC